MENTVQNKPAQAIRIIQGFSANTQVYLNSDRGSITHRLGADLKIEMPINFYKKFLDFLSRRRRQFNRQRLLVVTYTA
ncbi:MAG: hypothetical protein IPM97_00045 [Bdellovibrionaceae bacterium]|nr:hypothetical protein [Pseudobdellovibrionaceae bacterium]